jgi:hypothetical protein
MDTAKEVCVGVAKVVGLGCFSVGVMYYGLGRIAFELLVGNLTWEELTSHPKSDPKPASDSKLKS